MAHNPTLASSSNPTTPSSNFNYNYDVFINHRGPDVKKTFASHLYRMQAGDDLTSQIKRVIATASVHVAIFSQGYAESKWCLEELVLMLETGATIIPAFYHVKPSDLRMRTSNSEDGVYGRALRDLEKKKRYEPSIVQTWREALSRAADISEAYYEFLFVIY